MYKRQSLVFAANIIIMVPAIIIERASAAAVRRAIFTADLILKSSIALLLCQFIAKTPRGYYPFGLGRVIFQLFTEPSYINH